MQAAAGLGSSLLGLGNVVQLQLTCTSACARRWAGDCGITWAFRCSFEQAIVGFVKWYVAQPVSPDVRRARGFETRIHRFCRVFDFAFVEKKKVRNRGALRLGFGRGQQSSS